MELFDKISASFDQGLKFVNELPNTMWNKYLSSSLGVYDTAKDHDLLGLTFYWREMFHLVGGALVGLLAAPLFLLPVNKLIPCLLPIGLMAVGMGLKEFLGDASEQANGWDFKNVVDAAMWTLGTASVSLSIYFLS